MITYQHPPPLSPSSISAHTPCKTHTPTSHPDHDAHKARRRAIAPYFSKPNVASRQHLLRRNVETLRRRLDVLAAAGEVTFNLGAAISALTRDSANEFITGKRNDELDRGDFGIGLSIASQGAGPFWRITKHVRWFGPAMMALPVDWVMKVADENTKAFLGYLKVGKVGPGPEI